MQRVAIIDHGLCNVDSVWRAVEEHGAKADVTCAPADLELADKMILPGVGAFPDAMRVLEESGLAAAIVEQALAEQIPLLGICLGMQLLARSSTEVTPTAGLGLIDAEVVRLEPAQGERIPHVGWNEVEPTRSSPLFTGIPTAADFYFVHSFHVRCLDEADVLATTPYCGGFTSVVERANVFGTQFHPEKSQRHGLALLANFLAL